MTRSPASSEDEEHHSASECPEGGSESDSSPDGPGRGLRGTRGRGSGAPGSLASARGLQGRSMSVPDDAHFSMMVFRIGIPDLHQTVSGSGAGRRGDRGPDSHQEAFRSTPAPFPDPPPPHTCPNPPLSPAPPAPHLRATSGSRPCHLPPPTRNACASTLMPPSGQPSSRCSVP